MPMKEKDKLFLTTLEDYRGEKIGDMARLACDVAHELICKAEDIENKNKKGTEFLWRVASAICGAIASSVDPSCGDDAIAKILDTIKTNLQNSRREVEKLNQ